MATVIPTVMDKIRERAVVLTSKNELSRVIGLIIFLIPAIGFTHNFSHDQPEGVLNLPVIDTDPSRGLVLLETNPIDGAKMPRFAADATWPSLPTGYLIGQVSGVAVDQEGDIWVVNRPNSLHSMDIGATRSPPISTCCKPLKEVIEFDRDGKIKQNWSGRETAPLIDGEIQSPSNIHGIYVDTQNTVWIAGNGPGDHLVVRYTAGGEHIAQIGKRNKTNGNRIKNSWATPPMFTSMRSPLMF